MVTVSCKHSHNHHLSSIPLGIFRNRMTNTLHFRVCYQCIQLGNSATQFDCTSAVASEPRKHNHKHHLSSIPPGILCNRMTNTLPFRVCYRCIQLGNSPTQFDYTSVLASALALDLASEPRKHNHNHHLSSIPPGILCNRMTNSLPFRLCYHSIRLGNAAPQNGVFDSQ